MSLSDAESGASSSAASSSPDETELLVNNRTKREGAGNRLAHLLTEAQEENAEDELTLLFQNDGEEEDEEFDADAEDDENDAHLESSDDDEDQGPNATTGGDLDGEKELQNEAKVEKAKKRKALDALVSHPKKVRIASNLPHRTTTPKPTKKKERESWLYNQEQGPVRASSRRQTAANRELILEKLQEDEVKSKRTREQAARRAREREKNKPKEMTQEERLAEAVRTEKKNAKAVNRYEADEQKKAEERAAKLKAMHTKTLTGPVISWWSGDAEWFGPRLVRVGKDGAPIEKGNETKKRGRKPKGYWDSLDATRDTEADHSSLGTPHEQLSTPDPSETAANTPAPSDHLNTAPAGLSAQTNTLITFANPQGPGNFLSGIHEYAEQQSEPAADVKRPSNLLPPLSVPTGHILQSLSRSTMTNSPLNPQVQSAAAEQLVAERAVRNLVRLRDFAEDYPVNEDFGFLFQNRKTTKPLRANQEICPITSLTARYRDPNSGVSYHNKFAYEKLQRLRRHSFIWSSMLGCFVGPSGTAARGVPEGFLQDVLPARNITAVAT